MVITGTNFTGTVNVTFGGVDAASFTVNSGTQITAVTPPMAAGIVAVVVWTPTGSSEVGSSSDYTYSAASAPTVTGLGATSGSTAGGTSVTITGTGFTGASTVLFGTIPAFFTVNSATSITATAPSQAAGTVDVTVTTPSGASATSSSDEFTYSAASAPSVSGLSTTSGIYTGGTVVVVTGSDFTGASAVTFGGVPASFTVMSDTAIEATAPAGASTEDTQVTTPSGTSAAVTADQFTYLASIFTFTSITSLSSTTGGSGGGDTVTITGTGLLDTTEVTFGGQEAAFTVLSAGILRVTTPAMAAGSYDVVVSVPWASSSPARYTYTAASAPAVSSLGTTSGSTAGGNAVTITGTDFTGASQVLFGGVQAASFTVNSDTSITAVSPSAAAAGTVDVTVDSPTGTSEVSSSDEFTYLAASAPTLSSLSITSGSTVGGEVVNLIGTNFTGTTGVSFGSVAAAFTVQSATWITATVPMAASGAASVTVTTAGGTSSGVSYTYSAPSGPVVSGLTTTAGTTTGGDTTTITGSGFLGATSVSFGMTAGSFMVLSDTALFVTTPVGSAGTVNVTVTTAAGTSSTVTADEYTYAAPSAPTVTALSTSSGSGAGGDVILIAGTNLLDTTGVSFGGVPAASFVINSPTQITAVTPAEASGTQDVTVTTAAGTSATSSADQFTYSSVSAPAVTAVALTAGPLAGGNGVLITGSGFTGTTAVMFGTTPATMFMVISDTELFAIAPASAAGIVDVTVTTPAGTSSTSTADQYTYLAAPTSVVAAAASSSEIDLSWTLPSYASAVNIYRSTVIGGPATLAASGVTGTTFADTGLSSSTTYYYTVVAVDAYGAEGTPASLETATTL